MENKIININANQKATERKIESVKPFDMDEFLASLRTIGDIAIKGNLPADRDLIEIENYLKYCAISFYNRCEDHFFKERVKVRHTEEFFDNINKPLVEGLDPIADTARTAIMGINVILRKYKLPRLFSKNINDATNEEIIAFCKDLVIHFHDLQP